MVVDGPFMRFSAKSRRVLLISGMRPWIYHPLMWGITRPFQRRALSILITLFATTMTMMMTTTTIPSDNVRFVLSPKNTRRGYQYPEMSFINEANTGLGISFLTSHRHSSEQSLWLKYSYLNSRILFADCDCDANVEKWWWRNTLRNSKRMGNNRWESHLHGRWPCTLAQHEDALFKKWIPNMNSLSWRFPDGFHLPFCLHIGCDRLIAKENGFARRHRAAPNSTERAAPINRKNKQKLN